MKQSITSRLVMAAMAFLLLGAILAPAAPAYAQAITPPAINPASSTPTEDCTNIQERKNEIFGGAEAGKTGILSEIYIFIKDTVGTATQKLFSAFTTNQGYKNAVYWAMVLTVVFFGIGFTIGVVQVSFAEVLKRLLKFGIIAAVISPTGWQFFSDYAVRFFMDGTDELVKGVLAIGTGVTPPAGATPFYQLDRLADFLIQPDTIIQIMGATLAGGPYGMAMGALMGIASWGFVSLLVKALRMYAVTFVGRSLLLGIAPVFIVFLLFDRTKQMFISWLNALISMMLQPVLLFTFLSFFLVLIESAAKDMMSAELCWTEFTNVKGSDNRLAFWRFKTPGGEVGREQLTWKGASSCLIKGTDESGKPCTEFPINIVDILSFLILVYLAQRFSEVIERIANELSNAFILLDAGGKIDQFLSQNNPLGGKGMTSPVNKPAASSKPSSS
jgi:type IV secretion system protein VirB6